MDMSRPPHDRICIIFDGGTKISWAGECLISNLARGSKFFCWGFLPSTFLVGQYFFSGVVLGVWGCLRNANNLALYNIDRLTDRYGVTLWTKLIHADEVVNDK